MKLLILFKLSTAGTIFFGAHIVLPQIYSAEILTKLLVLLKQSTVCSAQIALQNNMVHDFNDVFKKG